MEECGVVMVEYGIEEWSMKCATWNMTPRKRSGMQGGEEEGRTRSPECDTGKAGDLS